MQLCALKNNENLKWIIVTVGVCIVLSLCIGNKEQELLGNLLLIAGQIFIVLSLSE